MKTLQIDSQYSTGLSRHNIEHALIAAGKDLKHLQPADLRILEDFHTLGRIATSQRTELAKIASQDEVLDAVAGSVEQLASSSTSTGAASPPSTSPRSTAKHPLRMPWAGWKGPTGSPPSPRIEKRSESKAATRSERHPRRPGQKHTAGGTLPQRPSQATSRPQRGPATWTWPSGPPPGTRRRWNAPTLPAEKRRPRPNATDASSSPSAWPASGRSASTRARPVTPTQTAWSAQPSPKPSRPPANSARLKPAMTSTELGRHARRRSEPKQTRRARNWPVEQSRATAVATWPTCPPVGWPTKRSRPSSSPPASNVYWHRPAMRYGGWRPEPKAATTDDARSTGANRALLDRWRIDETRLDQEVDAARRAVELINNEVDRRPDGKMRRPPPRPPRQGGSQASRPLRAPGGYPPATLSFR
jgi:hypothetical protein